MKTSNLIITILTTGLIAGTIDILSAIFILAGGDASGILRFVASGAFGKQALEGGSEYVVYGLIFHYIIAICWTGAFILLYPKIKLLHWNRWINAILYGLLVQTLMTFVVLPLTNIAQRTPTVTGFLKNALILMYAIGLPAAFVADRFYRRSSI